ncbi:DUF4230 domain-containing protein [Chryseobacterium sp. A301]
MNNYSKHIPAFLIGVLLTLLIGLLLKNLLTSSNEKVDNSYYVITNQIRKMNKMVVMEQDFSTIQRTKMSTEILGGGLLPTMDKEIVTFTKTNAQVSYDLNQLKVEVDSTNRTLTILAIPDPEIRIIPSVEISSVDDSFFNRIEQKDLQKIQKAAKDHALKSVNQKKLVQESKVQLRENLDQIFVLAKALNYNIVDETGSMNLLKL